MENNTNIDSNTSKDEAVELSELADKNIEQDTNSQELSSEEEIISLRNQVVELEDKLMRSVAEIENVRRRYDKMLADSRDYSVVSFAKDLLSVMDNLSRALEVKIDADNQQLVNIHSGVEMTKRELDSIFKKNGIDLIVPGTNDKFDYNLHHVISQIPSDEEPDIIKNVMQFGYKIKDRILRPAMVTVTKKIDENN